MKRALFLALALSCAPSFAQTQAELTQSSCDKLKDADKNLNATYQQVLKEYAKDKAFISKLKEAQRAWVKYRDAHLSSVWPEQDKQAMYGSSYPMCSCEEALTLTTERVAHLKEWLAPDNEGNVCAGSKK